jgi:photosystem II stability/assembly factor-like uncharacterized protein
MLNGVSFGNSTNGTAVGWSGSIVRSTDGGLSWVPQSTGPAYNLRSVSFADSLHGIAVGGWEDAERHYFILRTTDGGATWAGEDGGGFYETSLFGVFLIDPNTGFAVGMLWTPKQPGNAMSGSVFRTTDGGATWTGQFGEGWLKSVSFAGVNTGTAVGYGSAIIHTTNGGITWVRQSGGTWAMLNGVVQTDASIATAVGDSGIILRTTDGGASWSRQVSGTARMLNGVSFTDPNTGTVVGDSGTILRTTNGGALWTTQLSGTLNRLNGVCFTDANTGTGVGDAGTILRTTNGGATWALQWGLTRYNLLGVSFPDANNGTTVGQVGIVLKTTNGGTSFVEDHPSVRPLDGLMVGRLKVIPNPFVSFAKVPGNSSDRFALYDISGRRVGVYRGDRVGEGLSAGVYFLRTEKGERKPLRIVKVR